MRDNPVLDALRVSAARLDAHGVIVAVSRGWIDFGQRNGAAVDRIGVGVSYLDNTGGSETGVAARRAIERILAGQSDHEEVTYSCHGPDELRWFRMTATAMADGGLVVIHDPITELVIERQAMHGRVFGILELNPDLSARAIDSRWRRTRRRETVDGRVVEAELGHDWWEAVHPADVDGLRGTLEDVAAGAPDSDVPAQESMVRIRSNGGVLVTRVTARAHHADTGLSGIIMTICEPDAMSPDRPAGVDPLTGLSTRSALDAHLRLALGRAARDDVDVAVMFLDLDNFKPVNDTYGHHVGDRLLTMVAGRLQQCVRPSDLLVRLGGDEFVVVLADLDDHQITVRRVADRITHELSAAYQMDDGIVIDQITASIGVAFARADDMGREVVRRADAAMYRSKNAGKNRVSFAETGSALGFQITDGALQHAWDTGQFGVWFQPIVDLVADRVTGAEALLRWDHPEYGQLTAASFLPTARAAGRLVELGWWAIDRALATFPRDLGLDLHLNLDAHQLADQRRVDGLLSRLHDGELATRVVVELTETALSGDSDSVRTALAGLTELGVRVAIDDFGSGYSSFSQLRYVPTDLLKLDPVLVRGIDTDPGAQRILDGLVALADNLGQGLIAEGVEHPAELRILREHGVQLVQGYHVGDAVEASALSGLVGVGWAAAAQSLTETTG